MEFERQILDHGYLRLVESWGSDERIVEAARMSTGKGFLGWEPGPCPACGGAAPEDAVAPSGAVASECRTCEGKGTVPGDKKLLGRLWRKRHTTPFEMAGLQVEVQAPIAVFREWHRHRTWSYNEASARYAPLPNVNYVPSAERLLVGPDGKNRQAGTVKGAEVLTEEAAEWFRSRLAAAYVSQEELYREALRRGVPKELARLHVGVGRYSKMRAQAVLLNVLKYLSLRMPPDAMLEIRLYANALESLVARLFPRTHELFVESLQKQLREDAQT